MGAEGIADIGKAVSSHPALETITIDGHELPVSQLCARGDVVQGAVDFSDWRLGDLSGHGIGTMLRKNRVLQTFNLKHNAIGAKGVAAITVSQM